MWLVTKIKNMKRLFIILFSVIILAACSSDQKVNKGYLNLMETNLPGKLTITYPFNKAVFPAEFPEPSVIWNDNNRKSEQWIVAIKANSVLVYSELVEIPNWKIPAKVWAQIKSSIGKNEVEIIIAGINKDDNKKLQSGASVSITISEDEVGSPIFYRAVPLPFKYATSNLDSIKYMLGDISSAQKAKPLLENLPVCGNCHSFSPGGNKFAMDVDAFGDKGSYLIADIEKEVKMSPEKFITWSDFQEKSTMALLSQISPNGKYVVSTLDDNEIFESRDHPEYSQLFFPIKGILTLYDIEKKEFKALKGADDTMFVQSNSQWSPDNETIYFARSKAVQRVQSGMTYGTGIYDLNKFQAVRDSFLRGKKEFKFDLMKLPFNNGDGGNPEFIKGASKNNKSNYFPKISPDGNWLVFCQANNYMLLQPDSKLYIMPTDGSAEPREMNCNTNNMNSWHSWSPNGKWIVFSSKYFGAYTQLFLTHIDENAMDSPPVWLEYFNVDNRAANIPEFVNIDFYDWEKISDNFSDVADYNVRGTSKAQFGDFKNAIIDFNKAIQINKQDHQAYANRGKAKEELGDLNGAVADLSKAIELNPEEHDYYIHRGNTKVKLNDFEGAISDCSRAIKLQANDAALYAHRATVYQMSRQLDNAVSDLSKAIKLAPEYALYYVHRARVYDNLEMVKQAENDIDKAIALDPSNVQYITLKGIQEKNRGELSQAEKSFKKAIKVNASFYEPYSELALIYDGKNDLQKAIQYFSEAINKYDKNSKRDLAFILNNRGTVYGKTNDFNRAINDFTQAIQHYPNFTDAYSNRAFAKYNLRQITEAELDCNTALQIEPGFRKAQVIRDMIRKKK